MVYLEPGFLYLTAVKSIKWGCTNISDISFKISKLIDFIIICNLLSFHYKRHNQSKADDIGVVTGKILGGAKDFCPIFPKIARKDFGTLFLQIFFH